MSQTYYAILTAIGEAKLANATALGTTLKLTAMAVGDGGGSTPQPDRDQKKLVNEKRRAPLNSLYVDPLNPSQIVAEQIIPEDVGGWWIREGGLYDPDGNLCAVANFPDTYKPLLASGSGRVQTIRIVLVVSNTAAVMLKIDPSVVLATRDELKRVISAHLEATDPHPQYTTEQESHTIAVEELGKLGIGGVLDLRGNALPKRPRDMPMGVRVGLVDCGELGVGGGKGTYGVMYITREWVDISGVSTFQRQLWVNGKLYVQIGLDLDTWGEWRRVDGADWSDVRDKPTTLDGYGITDAATLKSPTFTDKPTAPTPDVGDNSKRLVNTEYVARETVRNFALGETGGAPTWVRLGRWSGASQVGRKLYLKLITGAGYNALNDQSAICEVHFQTANGINGQTGSSGDFYGSGWGWVKGASALGHIFVVQIDRDTFDFYVQFLVVPGPSTYQISIAGGKWGHDGAADSPSGNYIDLPVSRIATVEAVGAKPGTLTVTFADTPPAGTLVCNGAAVSRATYANLFAAIGTKYGAGNGLTTFNLPNIPDGYALLAGAASNVGKVVTGDVISHSHTASSGAGGSHTHSAWTGTDGAHQHYSGAATWVGNGGNASGGAGVATGGGTWDGAHAHGVGVGAVGDHSHAVTVNAAGGSANLAAGIKLLPCIVF
ncbi:phage tail protein [Crenobacter sp. SG2305]|uniref:phage tail-collar fiber domain-containing protein n=1 Tax=Crenobacter oryzisoli TaxID=3056844 RepID=UPI0025AAB652|nr:phage tail protein [Crenobacter sp. SG2305]MDN0081615.1 phage tail protein [Crenobacter sp. SG2305]